MDEQTHHRTPRDVIKAVEASVKDIADGNLRDADDVQAESRLMLTDYERTRQPKRGKAASRGGAT
jgi:hypothetical protein